MIHIKRRMRIRKEKRGGRRERIEKRMKGREKIWRRREEEGRNREDTIIEEID